MAKVTIQTIADAVGVSKGAVSQCLRNPGLTRFSKETRQRILDKARELNYVANQQAASLRGGRTHCLGMVVPWNTPEVLDVAEMEAKKHGYSLSIHFTDTDLDAERQALRHTISQRVDGLIWLPSDTAWEYKHTIDQLQQAGVRTAFLEVALPGLPEAGLVEVDYKVPMKLALDGFRATGCREFLLISSLTHHHMRANRITYFKNYLKRHKLKGRVVVSNLEGEGMSEALEDFTMPVGVICESDWRTLSFINLAKARGFRIPEDIQLVGVGDMLLGGHFRVGELSEVKYSAIRRPSGEMARQAVHMLVEALKDNGKTSLPKVQLASELILRRSTLPATKAC